MVMHPLIYTWWNTTITLLKLHVIHQSSTMLQRGHFTKTISWIANILAYSSMRSHSSFWYSKLQSHNPVKSILSKSSLSPFIWFFFTLASTPTNSFFVGFSSNRVGMASVAVISPTQCLGRVICLHYGSLGKHQLCLLHV